MKGYSVKIKSIQDYAAFVILNRTLIQFGAIRMFKLSIDDIIKKCYESRNRYSVNNGESIYYNMTFWPSDCGVKDEGLRKYIKIVYMARFVNDPRFDESLIKSDFLIEFVKASLEIFENNYSVIPLYGECVLNALRKLMPHVMTNSDLKETKKRYNELVALLSSVHPLNNDSFVIGDLNVEL